jgi:hypothetical protein
MRWRRHMFPALLERLSLGIGSCHHDHAAVLWAFDVIELDGQDQRRLPIAERERTLAMLASGLQPGIAVNEHYVGDGDTLLTCPSPDAAGWHENGLVAEVRELRRPGLLVRSAAVPWRSAAQAC